MIYLGVAIGVLLVLGLVLVLWPQLRNWMKHRRDYEAAKATVHGDKDRYNFLINKDFRVLETNFYELNWEMDDGQPNVLGNVLHCETGCDSGLCGTGIACKTCPVRMILTNSFKQRRDFNDVAATMRLYNKDYQVKEVDVRVDGQLVYLGYEPHFIVGVRT
ncbi:MAG: hypothetical protein IJ067_07355 [Prevotella sp.]|nr:hypothetical protein [Prevotella sp.]